MIILIHLLKIIQKAFLKGKLCEKDTNKKLIERIYLENNEIEAIKILDKTYIEVFNSLIKNDLDNFCEEILEKETKNGLTQSDSANYLKEIKNLCQNYVGYDF